MTIDFNPEEYLDRKGIINFQGIAHAIRHDKDWVCLIVGPEREGKSTLGQIATGIVDPKLDIRHITFPTAELRYAISRSPKYRGIIQDEGAETWLSADGNTKEARKMVRSFMQIGEKNLFIVIIVPDFQSVKRFLAKHRAHTLLRVKKRGTYFFYSKNRIAKIKLQASSRTIIWPQPNFIGHWKKLPETAFTKEYVSKAHEHKFGRHGENPKIVEEELKMDKFHHDTVDFHDAARMLGMNQGTLATWAYGGVLRKRYKIKTVDTVHGKKLWLRDVATLRKRIYGSSLDRLSKDERGEKSW